MKQSLEARARLLAAVRLFFAQRGVLEVETPILAPTTGTDVYIDSFTVPMPEVPGSLAAKPGSVASRDYYLQTSPEFAMKRLLAAGSGPIYQLSKVFRAGESSRLHNPEFTMLEWYRPGYDLDRLMREVAELLHTTLLPQKKAKQAEGKAIAPKNLPRFSYRHLFQEHLGFDPHTVKAAELTEAARSVIDIHADSHGTHSVQDTQDKADKKDPTNTTDTTGTLQQLMALVIEPRLPEFCFVYDYPAAQCALAQVEADTQGVPVARRFELYGRGMELANGYQELTDPAEQRRRFEADLQQRRAQGRTCYPIDKNFLAALANMPPCAGVALGIDRLLMLLTGTDSIAEVLTFTTHDNAG